MAEGGSHMRGFKGKGHELAGPLPGAINRPPQSTFKTAGKMAAPAGGAPSPLGKERFAGPGGKIAELAKPEPAPTKATPAALGHPKEGAETDHIIVLKIVRPDGQKGVLRYTVSLPTDAEITGLTIWDAADYKEE